MVKLQVEWLRPTVAAVGGGDMGGGGGGGGEVGGRRDHQHAAALRPVQPSVRDQCSPRSFSA